MKNTHILMLILLTFMLSCGNAETGARTSLTVVYTANSDGKLRDCNCPGDPYGGLSERLSLIRELRDREEPFLLVDAGNMVTLFGEYDLRAEAVMQLMNLMGYDAAGVGRNELYMGTGQARAMDDIAGFPLISASVISEDASVFPTVTIVQTGDVSTAVIAVGDSSSMYIGTDSTDIDYAVRPAHDAVGVALESISGAVDFIVVLSSMNQESNRALLQDFPAIDLIVEGYGNKRYDQPVVTPDGVIVSPGGRGQFTGLITIMKSGGNSTVTRAELIPVNGYPQDTDATNIVRRYYDSIDTK